MPASREPQVTSRLFEAMSLAFELHGHDVRKSTTIPMMTHLLSVCGLVLHDGGDEDEAIGALLHDALEDKPELITLELIADGFGKKVADIVEISTDTPRDFRGGPKPPWRDRKQAYLDRVRRADPSILRATVADKVDNVRAILADHRRLGDALWDRFNAPKQDQLWYYQAASDAYKTAGLKTGLILELEKLVDELRFRLVK